MCKFKKNSVTCMPNFASFGVTEFILPKSKTLVLPQWHAVLEFFLFLTFFWNYFQIWHCFFFKTNIFGRAYSHGAAKSHCYAMHGGAVGSMTWQRSGPLNADVAGAAMPWIWARHWRAMENGAAMLPPATSLHCLHVLSAWNSCLVIVPTTVLSLFIDTVRMDFARHDRSN